MHLLDGGTTDTGTPYIVMEYVDGTPLSASRTRPVRDRLELVIRIAEALQYAHGRLVVHRDIKPSNVLVDRHGAPRLLDFGIAKLLDDGAREATTRTGMSLLTPEYASPEQARGEAVTVATDVYSLGAVLYGLLVGVPPHDTSADTLTTLKRICEVDPPRPSSIVPSLDSDLDSIVLKALQKRPDRRYATAAAFADDLRRYLDGFPVHAREATFAYRAMKHARRHAGKLVLGLSIAIVLLGATIVSVRQTRRAEHRNRDLVAERGWQELAAGYPDRALPFLVKALRAGDDSPALRFSLAEAARPLSHELARLGLRGLIRSVAWSPDGSHAVLCGAGRVARVHDRDGRSVVELPVDAHHLYNCSFSPDGRRLAGGDGTGRVFVWELPSGRLLLTAGGEHPIPRVDVTQGVAFLANGDRVLAGGRDRVARIWEVASGRVVQELRPPGEITSIAVSADEARIATGLVTGDIVVWDAATGEQLATLSGHRDWVSLRFSRDRARLFSASWDGSARIWDLGSRTAIVLAGLAPIYLFDVSADEAHLLTSGGDHTPRMWNATTGALELHLVGHARGSRVRGRFDPTGTRVVTFGSDRMFRVWDARRGVEVLRLPALPGGSSTGPVDGQVSPDGTRLLAASSGGATLWRLDAAPLLAMFTAAGPGRSVVRSPDERLLAVVGYDTAEIWDIAARTKIATLANADPRLEDVGWSADGTHVVAAGWDRVVRIYTATGGLVRELRGHTSPVNRVAYSPDGARILSAGGDRTARLWDASTGVELASLVHPDRVMSAAWSRDGRQIATGGSDGRVRVWDAASYSLVAELENGSMSFLDVNFSPDGSRVAASGLGGEAVVWNVATRVRDLAIAAHEVPVTTVTWSPDGTLLATTADEPIARIWDAQTGKLLGERPHTHSVMAGVWNRAGTELVTSCQDGTVRIWDVSISAADPGVFDELIERDPYRLVDDRLELK